MKSSIPAKLAISAGFGLMALLMPAVARAALIYFKLQHFKCGWLTRGSAASSLGAIKLNPTKIFPMR